MKKNAKILYYMGRKKISWQDNDGPDAVFDPQLVLDAWPDLKRCTALYYDLCPEMAQYQGKKPPLEELVCTTRFLKSLDRHCTTGSMRLRLIDALAKLLFRIPSTGLGDAPIKEKDDLRHLRISFLWRVFYQRDGDRIRLLEFCPHKNRTYSRRG